MIARAEALALFMALPRGCVADVERLLRGSGTELAIEDQRYEGTQLAPTFRGELTPVQKEAARALLAHDTGVFVGSPEIGKTVLGRISSRSVVARRCSRPCGCR